MKPSISLSMWPLAVLALAATFSAYAANDAPNAKVPAQPPNPVVAPESGSLRMVRIPAGEFLMGSPADEPRRQDREGPQHKVTISKPFLLGVSEVTQGQWLALMGANPSGHKTCGYDCPVEQVSWHDAIDYCNRLSEMEGLSRCYSGAGNEVRWDRSCKGYRLPTEAEWEYAARAGTTTAFAGGPASAAGANCETDDSLHDMAWYCATAGLNKHRAVMLKKPNAWGLYDMHGNLSEWVWDWDGDYSPGPAVDPAGPASGSDRVLRGGCWVSKAWACRSASRGALSPGSRFSINGFRVARSLP